MQKIIKNKKFIFTLSKIEEINTDALILWTTPELNSGDNFFVKVHKEAGSLLYDGCIEACLKYGSPTSKTKVISPGQVVITEAGNLNVYNVIHCVLPNYRDKMQEKNKKALINNCILSIMELIKAYSEVEIKINTLSIPPISTNLYGEIADEDLINYFETIIKLSSVKKVFFVFENQEELDKYFEVFNKMTTPFYERIINKIFKFSF